MNLKLWSLWGTVFYSGDHDVIMLRLACTLEHILPGYSCEMHTAWYVTGRLSCLADSIARCHSRQYFSINQLGTGWSYVEKPAKTQTTVASGLLATWSKHLTPILKGMSLKPLGSVGQRYSYMYRLKRYRYTIFEKKNRIKRFNSVGQNFCHRWSDRKNPNKTFPASMKR